MTNYTVVAGDTMVRIAKRFGFPEWRTIYNAPENAGFRAQRPNPDKIFPGDQLVIPDRDGAGFQTGRTHRFKLLAALPPVEIEGDWDRGPGPAMMHAERTMVVTGDELPAGVEVTFTVSQIGFGELGSVTATSSAGRAEATWADWFQPARVTEKVQLAAGQEFPQVRFTFVATALGLTARSGVMEYFDKLDAKIVAPQHVDGTQPIDYILYSPWGTRTGTATPDGALLGEKLPPGGCSVVFVQEVLVPT